MDLPNVYCICGCRRKIPNADKTYFYNKECRLTYLLENKYACKVIAYIELEEEDVATFGDRVGRIEGHSIQKNSIWNGIPRKEIMTKGVYRPLVLKSLLNEGKELEEIIILGKRD